MTNRQVLLLVLVISGVLLVPCAAAMLLGLGWFLMPPWQAKPSPAPSAFHSACQDLGAVLQRALPADGFTLEPRSTGTGSGGGAGRMQAHTRWAGAVQCRPEDRGRLLPALKAEFERLGRETGAAVEGAGEDRDQAGDLVDFALRYTAGGAHGEVRATLGEGKPAPGKPGVESYPLTVKVEESVP